MQLKVKHEFHHPMDLVLQVTHFDIVKDLDSFKETVGMSEMEIIHYEEFEDGSHEVELLVSSPDRIPPLVRHVIKPHMLTWRQLGKWNPEKKIFYFKTIPAFFRNSVDIRGSKRYVENNGGADLRYSIDVHVGIPIVGPILENAIIREIAKEQKNMFAMMERNMAAHVS
jgi:hypothetical protein